MFDSAGNLYVSDTLNNCVRKIDTGGNVTTVAGLRVIGGADTCNPLTNPAPTTAQGLFRPTGLAIDSANTLYIADSLHNCVRSIASGAVDSFTANALTTVAGTCSNLDTASVTPVPNGLAIDGGGNLYISIQDTVAALPVNQVVQHLASAAATAVCYVGGQPSVNVANACAGVTSTVSLVGPAGLAFDVNGNLFIADTGNNCVREVAGLTTQQTAVGQCANDATGSATTSVASPYGLAFSPAGTLYISEAAGTVNKVAVFLPGLNTLTPVAGLPSGAPGPYSALLDGQSSESAPLNAPLGLTTDTNGNIYLADSLNNVVREMSTGAFFPATSVGASSAGQILNFAVYQAVNLSVTSGPDYTVASNTCTGAQSAVLPGAPPNTCQVTVKFSPTRPGTRSSALQIKDSVSNKLISVALTGAGIGPLSLFTPGTASSAATRLRTPIAVAMDSAGDAYVLEQGNGTDSADILLVPAGGGAPVTVVAQGTGLRTPTAMAVDGAGNIFVSDAGFNGVTRYGADGSTNVSYVTGLQNATALAVDKFDNLYIAQAGSTNTVIEVYQGGTARLVAGGGTVANADGVPATSALFQSPSGLALGPAGLYIADSNGHLVYAVDGSGNIHIVAGNGTVVTTTPGQALGTGILLPIGLAADAAGDLYIADAASNLVYEVYPVSNSGANIATPLGTGSAGYTGDGGPAPAATLNAPLSVGVDGSGDLFTIDSDNSALREVLDPASPNINFGNVIIGSTSGVKEQTLFNAGNVTLSLTTPFTTTDSHYAVSSSTTYTTCTAAEVPGGACMMGFTFTPTVLGPLSAQSNVNSSFFGSPQTIQLNGYGLYTQNLPFTLVPETEVYGQPFTESALLNIVYPDMVPTGSMTFTISGETTCTIGGPFPGNVNCAATESGLGVGTYVVHFSYASGDIDYLSTTATTTLTITPGSLTVTPTNETKAYLAPIPGLPATISGTVNGDVFLFSNTTTASASSPAGIYPINATLTPVGLASLNNYNVQYNVGTLTITPLPLTVTVTVASGTRPYGGANPTPTYTVAGGVNGDTFNVTVQSLPGVTAAAGTYSISATVTGSDINNYAVTVVPGTLTITPIPLTLTVGNASRVYATANPGFTSSISGAINGDTFTNSYSTTATIASPVGTYPITDVLGGPAAGNYTVTLVPGTLTITPTAQPLTITANNATRLYGAANPTFTSSVAGALNGDSFTITYATTATAASPVGSYTIVPTVTGAAAANYSNIVVSNGILTVTPAPLSVAANSATRAYGAANPTFTGTTTGALNGDTFTITYATTATTASAAGTYPIVPTVAGAATGNYTVTTTNGTLTVTDAATPLVISVNGATRVYGAANPTFTSTVTGAVNGDTFTVTYATAASAASAVGSYTVTPTVSGATLADYASVVVNNGTLTVTPAPLNVAVNNASRAYGAVNPAFSSTLTGAVNGNTFTVTYATTATASSPAGSYPIVPTVTGAALGNYTLTTSNGTLTVTDATAPLVVTVNNATRTYGAANPTFTSTVAGALNGDTFTITYATTATAASPVGSYTVVPTVSGAAVSNYTSVVVNNGTLTVTPAPLSVSANNATRAYGAANPTFTNTTTGALNGDTFTISDATTATAASAAGTYPIIPTVSGVAAGNYTVATSNGVLTVTEATAPLVVTVNNAAGVYGAALPPFTSTITGAVNGDTFTVTYATTATAGSPAGTYPISATVTGSALGNYTLNIAPGTLTIAPAMTSTALATSAATVFIGTSITFTATVSSTAGIPGGTVSFFNGTTLLGMGTVSAAGVATFSTSALTAGTYTITATYQPSGNYATSSGTVSQTVTPGTFTITATPPVQFIRGPGTTTYSVTVSGMQNFSGPVVLSCAGLPADASCSFSTPTVNLAVNGSATTNLIVVNTAADARLDAPAMRLPGHTPGGDLFPIALAAVFPFELTGLGVFFAGLSRRRRGQQKEQRHAAVRSVRTRRMRLIVALLCSAGVIGLAGCACFTSLYQNYTITVTGTNSTVGSQPQSTTVLLSVGAQ